MFLRLLFFALACILFFSFGAVGVSLRPGGLNVCSRRYTYNTYYKMRRTRIGYVNYRTCCKKLWFVCTSRCTRSRTRIVYYTVNKLKVKSSTSYYCCPGWARSGNECPNAICRPSCQNGNCIAPNVCRCKPGFKGKYCEQEINECKASPIPCQQICKNLRGSYACSCRRGYRKIGSGPKDKGCHNVNECLASNRLCMCAVDKKGCRASCVDTIGSYRCQCSSGYRLISNKICTDVNECQTGSHGCRQICLNLHGGYKCACRTGYWLSSDKKSCYDINECRRTNGGCEQVCTNTVGSFRCSCRRGFKLMYDKTRCQDIDECLRSRPCDRNNGVCQNTYGSFKCLCRKGYQLQRDGKTCSDVNECQGANQCQQNCHNSEGSYFCSCRKGFSLAADRKSCVDVNECSKGLHDCDQVCLNNIGSYRCQCKRGYVLQANKKTCRALPCKRLYPPHSGFVRCTGLNLGQKCTYTCRKGYKVVGNKERTCQLSSRWSGGVARCYPESCQPARPPINGLLLLPCMEEFKSTCIVDCKKGFLLRGSSTMKCGLVNGKVAWQNSKTICEEIKLCRPNPCKNGGKCQIKSDTGFECDCTGTGYTGEHCQFGSITITSYPPLVNKKMSSLLTITAKPSKELIITPEAFGGVVVFVPKKITIKYPRSFAQFRIVPRSSGLIRIKYQLSGWNRLQFQALRDTLIYVSPLEASERVVRIPDKTFPLQQCKKMKLDKCADGKSVELVSSCLWTKTGTTGYQSVLAGNVRIPFSLGGISLPKEGLSSWVYRKSGALTVSKETTNMLKRGPGLCSSSACRDSSVTKAEHRFLIQQNLFMRSVMDVNSKLLPEWLNIGIENGYTGFHVNNIQSMLLKSYRMKDLPLCFNFPAHFQPGIYATQVAFLPIAVRALSKNSISQSTYPSCIARSLCKDLVYYSLPKDKSIDLTSDLKAMNIKSLELRIHGLGFSGSSNMEKACWRTFDSMKKQFVEDCIQPKIFLKLSGQLLVDSAVNLTISGEVRVAASNLQLAAVKRFSVENKYSFNGEVLGSIGIKVGGKTINFQLKDDNTKGYGTIGGAKPDPVSDAVAGFNFQTASSSIAIKHQSTLATFRPRQSGNESHVQFSVLTGLAGGDVHGVQNGVKIRLMMRSFTRSLPSSATGLLMVLRQRRTIYRTEYAMLEAFKKNAASPLAKIKGTVSQANVEYRTVERALERLKNLVEGVGDVLALLQTRVTITEKSFALRRRIIARISFMKRLISRANGLNAVPRSKAVVETSSGVVVKYTGRLCFHVICFDNMRTSVYDLKSPNRLGMKSRDAVLISAAFTEDQNIAGLLDVRKNDALRAEVARNADYFTLELPATTKLFGKRVAVKFEMTQTKASFKLANFELSSQRDGLDFDLEVSAKNSKSTTWQSLFFSISAKAASKAKIKSDLEAMVATYVKEASSSVKNRLGKAAEKVISLAKSAADKKASVGPKKAAFERELREYTRIKGIYNASLAVMYRSLKTFRSYRVSEFFRKIEKRLNSRCMIEQCKQFCIPVPICNVCQEAVMVDANTLQCNQVAQKAITTVEQPLQSQCALVDYRFTPIYTGTCKRGKQAKLGAALTGIGAGTGALVGAAIAGPPGAVVGAVIGTIVGGIASLFSSCDETYTVHTEVINSQVDCTRKTFRPKTTFWKEAKCYAMKKNVLSGYDNPKQCGCNNNTCVIVQSTRCMQGNAVCIAQRRAIVRISMEEVGVYNNSYEKLDEAQSEVRVNFLKSLQAEKKYLFAKRDYERAAAMVRQAELEVKLANASLANSNQNFALELCLGRLKSAGKASLIKVNQISFDSETAANEDILFKLDVMQTATGKRFEKNFLYDLRDPDVSLDRGAKRLAREIFCPSKTRGRRSVGGKAAENGEGRFVQSTTSIPDDSSEAQRACLVSRTVFTFLRRSSEDLLKRVQEVTKKERDIKQSIVSIKKSLETPVAADSVVDQNRMLSTLKDSLESDVKSLTAWDVIEEWKASMETMTGVSNFTRCLNFEDCIEEARRQLKALPSLYKMKRSEYHSLIDNAEFYFFKVLSARTMDDLLEAAVNQRSHLRTITRASFFCASKPEVTLRPVTRVAVTIGSTLSLICIVQNSLLPVKYSWTHNKVHLLSADSNALVLNVDDESKQGAYRCMATSLAGKAVSRETYVEVRRSPQLVKQPQDFLYYLSMVKEIVPHFACNTTADPPAMISWYFQPYESSKVTQFAYDKPVLRIHRPRFSDSGFYYCTAENDFGKITSRRARLDVLKSGLPNQAFTVSYNVQVGRSGAPEKAGYERHLKSKGKLAASQKLDVAYEYKSGRDVNVTVQVTDDLEKEKRSDNKEVSAVEMLRAVSRSRLRLSGVMQRIVTSLTENKGRSANAAFEKSVRLGFNGELCKRGYFLHSNGFTCVECPSGSFEHNGQCINCSIGTYQEQPGKTSCTKCNNNQVTRSIGSVNIHQCIDPEFQSTDIIFALDSSGSIGLRNWRNVKSFVTRFALQFVKADNDLKLGVITFGTNAYVRIPLRSYTTSQLESKVKRLPYYGGFTRTSEGLRMAAVQFKQARRAGRKQVLFVMTDGKSTSIGGLPGFVLARRAALTLLNDGIHIVSVGVGGSVDPMELQAIAAYPKKDNVIRYGSFRRLVTASKRISATALRGECFSRLKDIAIVVEGSRVVRSNRWHKAKEFVSELLSKLSVTSDNKVSLATFSADLRSHRGFASIESQSQIKSAVDQMARDYRSADYRGILRKVYNDVLNEKGGSLSSTKIVVFLTKGAFDRGVLRQVRRYYPSEKVRLINVALDLRGENGGDDDDDDVSASFEEKNAFTMTQLSNLVDAIESTNFAKQSCRVVKNDEFLT